MRLFSLNKWVLVLVVLTTALLVFAGCSTAEETPDIEQTAEAEGRSLAERIAAQLTAEAPTLAPTATLTPKPSATPRRSPVPTAIPTETVPPVATNTPAPTDTPTPTPTVTPTPTRTPRPTATPIPRFLGETYTSADGVKVTLKTLTATKLGNVTTVSVTYTLENDTSGLKEEKSWKMFYQGSGGQAFGFNGAILPNSSIDRSFTFGAVAPNGLLRLVYPADTLDESWDVTRLLLP